MVVHKCFAILTFILFGAFMGSPSNDSEFPKDYFRLPVNRSIKLSGTFGELRPNHFHAGLDIKSLNGTSGEPLYAAAGLRCKLFLMVAHFILIIQTVIQPYMRTSMHLTRSSKHTFEKNNINIRNSVLIYTLTQQLFN